MSEPGAPDAPPISDSPDEPFPPAPDLLAAVGAPTRKPSEREDEAPDAAAKPPRNLRAMMLGAGALALALVIVTFIFLGRANSDRYLLACSTDHVGAEQGRGFPPWGTRALAGPEWAPIAIRPETECRARETENADELAGWYLDLLVDQATARLTAREVTDVEGAYAQLQQALLLARSPARRDQRKDLERMLGDVDYWRATQAARKAADELAAIAKQYDNAAAQRPRHVSDAAAWAAHVRHVVDELRAGPNGAPSVTFPSPSGAATTAEHAPAPPFGTALPIEPGEAGSAAPAPAPPAPTPDAGVPTGGVLL